MVPIAFSIVSFAACAFLLYALAQFRRESAHPRKVSANPALLGQTGQRTNKEAVMRKEVLAGAFMGLAALLSPFLFVLLLHWPRLR